MELIVCCKNCKFYKESSLFNGSVCRSKENLCRVDIIDGNFFYVEEFGMNLKKNIPAINYKSFKPSEKLIEEFHKIYDINFITETEIIIL